MFNITFAEVVRKNRRQRSLTQQEAAAMTGMTVQRWNHLELGNRHPAQSEIVSIYRLFGMFEAFIPPPDGMTKLGQAGRQFLSRTRAYFPPSDRPARVRYYSALKSYPQAVPPLTAQIRARSDARYCEFFCHKLSLDSGLEALHVMQLLAEGALPALLAPASLGRTPRPLVEPLERHEVSNRRFPCLILGDRAHFFQVTFSTPQLLRVDCLIWDDGWRVLEIDGPGHRTEYDAGRQEALGLKIDRISERELLAA